MILCLISLWLEFKEDLEADSYGIAMNILF